MTPLTDEQRAMVEANLSLVAWVVERWHALDPEQAKELKRSHGTLGLIRAAQLYDPERGTFSTYAVYWIRSAIQNGVLFEEDVNYRHALGKHGRRRGDYVRPLSLDRPFDEHADRSLVDTLVDETGDVADQVLDREMFELLRDVMLDACRDDVDRAVVAALAAGVTMAELAGVVGEDDEVLRRRRQRIQSRVRHPVSGVARRLRGGGL